MSWPVLIGVLIFQARFSPMGLKSNLRPIQNTSGLDKLGRPSNLRTSLSIILYISFACCLNQSLPYYTELGSIECTISYWFGIGHGAEGIAILDTPNQSCADIVTSWHWYKARYRDNEPCSQYFSQNPCSCLP